jgi:hypothetical protein
VTLFSLPRVLVAVLLCAILIETMGMPPWTRNAALDVGLAAILLTAFIRRCGLPRDLPFPRSRFALIAIPAAAALVNGMPLLTLPYFADDFFHLEWLHAKPTPLHALLPRPDDIFFRPVGWLP